MSRHIVIIGNGVAGITAARFVRKACDDRITVISSESDHFFSRTALMYVYMGHLTYEDTKPYEDWFWARNRIELVRGYVSSVDAGARRVNVEGRGPIDYDVLVIASGSRPNRFGWPGQDLRGVQGLYSLQDLEAMEAATAGVSRAVVVGGGLIGIEMAEMLHSRHIPVTFLVREAGYMDYLLPAEESEMINREIRRHGIDLRLSTELAEILGDGSGRARALRTASGDVVECEFVGLTVGVSPNIDFLGDSGIELDRGVLVNEFFETSRPGVYAIGDCAQFRDEAIGHRPIEQLWYTARKHGRTVARSICRERTAYDRGVFFNSAKFFTLEYQTYGDIRSGPSDGRDTLAWQDAAGERLLRIDFEAASGRVLGFNAIGVRLRHEQCERWIVDGCTLDRVLNDLPAADFDPELGVRPVEMAAASWSLVS